ncbi:MAG: hypothetical protein ACXVJ7_13840 [Acidimicrobiia bacterium]
MSRLRSLVLGLLCAVVAACGSGISSPTTTRSASTTTTADTGTTSTTTNSRAAPCTAEAILPVVKAAYAYNPALAEQASVSTPTCRNGYAYVSTLSGEFQTERVYLRDVAGTWVIVARGSGLACSDAEMQAVCAALGGMGAAP